MFPLIETNRESDVPAHPGGAAALDELDKVVLRDGRRHVTTTVHRQVRRPWDGQVYPNQKKIGPRVKKNLQIKKGSQ